MDGLEQLIETDKITPAAAEKLKLLPPDAFCQHKSWGYGQIKAWDTLMEQIVIDFDTKPGHTMQLAFAAESLTPLPATHFFARRKGALADLKAEAASNPCAVMSSVIQSLGFGSTADAIEKALCPSVISKEEWKKWWDGAKRAMRKDGRFTIPTGKTATFKFQEAVEEEPPVTYAEAAQVRGLKPMLEAAELLLKKPDSVKEQAEEVAPFIKAVEETLAKAPASQKDATLRLALVRDGICDLAGITPNPQVATEKFVREFDSLMNKIMSDLPAEGQVRLLGAIKKAEPHTWMAASLRFLSTASTRLVNSMREFFEREGQLTGFLDALKRGVREQSLSSEAMLWVFKNRKGETAFLIEPRTFSALLSSIERDQIGDRKSAKLHDLVISDRDLLTDLIKDSDMDAVRDVTRGLLLTTVFDEMDKRSLLARIIKIYPDMQDLVTASFNKAKSGDGRSEASVAPGGDVLIVSWHSLEKRKAELDDLVNKKIPANTQEIAVARSYGDLRENAEFKFAKEQQRVLGRRRAELESEVMRANGTDFKDVDPSKVAIGTIVTLSIDGKEITYTILGAWDGDPTKRIVSYLTPLAKALHGKKVGETALIPTEDGTLREVVIKAIEAFAK